MEKNEIKGQLQLLADIMRHVSPTVSISNEALHRFAFNKKAELLEKLKCIKPDEAEYIVGAADASGEVYDYTEPQYYVDLKAWKERIATLNPITHLITCNTKQDWTEAILAMGDTPHNLRDETWHIAYEEMRTKMNTCNCGASNK